MNKILFRCSSFGNLMTNAQGKSNLEKYNEALQVLEDTKLKLSQQSATALKTKEKLKEKIAQLEAALPELEKVKDEIKLSATCKKELRKIMIEHRFNRRKRIQTKQMTKGIEQEEEAITILSIVTGTPFKNNKTRVANDLMMGEYDCAEFNKDGKESHIIDIKNRYDIDTFFDNDEEENKAKDYWQLVGYTALYPTTEKGTIANVLANNTDDAIGLELKREEYFWNEGIVPQERQIEIIADNCFDAKNFKRLVSMYVGYLENEEAIEAFNSFVEVPLNERVILVSQPRDEDAIEKVNVRLKECLIYLEQKYNI